MTDALKKAMEAIEALPDERQDEIAEFLLSLAAPPDYELTPEQIEGVKLAREEVARGEFATDEEVRKAFGRSFE